MGERKERKERGRKGRADEERENREKELLYKSVLCCRKISELFLLKDVSHIPNYMWFKYTSARIETRYI